jgi:two-component system NtrC family sensor kinase
MLPAFVRTLSARIVLGYAALILTFGITMAWIVSYMDEVGIEIAVIRTGYLQLAFKTKELDRKQEDLRSYLADDLITEPSPRRVEYRLRGFRASRDKILGEALAVIDGLDNLRDRHIRNLAETRADLESIRASIAEQATLYTRLLAAPPLERRADGPTADPAALEASLDALTALRTAELRIRNRAQQLAQHHEWMVVRIANNLEQNEERLRSYTMYTGVIATILGLLVTVWATVNLRSLRRLRDAARRIAAGDYGSRIPDDGPAEVADLAREFNAMGHAVEERERELVRSERLAAVGKMAAMITHEVRNPLSSIGLNTELLEEELSHVDGAVEAGALCRAITREVDRLAAITEEYLAFARLPKPRLAAEQVNAIVESLASFVRDDLASRAVALDLELADDLPRAMVDEGQIRQSLLNLVRNAAEAVAGEGGGCVTITTRRGTSGRVEVEVRDDGPGIAEDALPRVFDPFFSTKEGGTGLGLALTHHIVRDHGGEIRVTSQVGEGATFVVALPVA